LIRGSIVNVARPSFWSFLREKLNMMAERIKELKKGEWNHKRNDPNRSTRKTRINLEKWLDTLIYIHESTNDPIKISDAIKAIRRHAIDIYESENYSITHYGIRKIKDDGNLGEIVYRVKENA